jgi:hypothetical protein
VSGDRVINAKCVGAEPKEFQGIPGWAFNFESDELEDGHASKVFWLSPDLSEKSKAHWSKTLTLLGFNPNGRSAEDWARISEFVTGAEVKLVIDLKERGGRMRENIKFINSPADRGAGEADVTATCNAAAVLFGGAQAKLPLIPPPVPGYNEVAPQNDDSEVPF